MKWFDLYKYISLVLLFTSFLMFQCVAVVNYLSYIYSIYLFRNIVHLQKMKCLLHSKRATLGCLTLSRFKGLTSPCSIRSHSQGTSFLRSQHLVSSLKLLRLCADVCHISLCSLTVQATRRRLPRTPLCGLRIATSSMTKSSWPTISWATSFIKMVSEPFSIFSCFRNRNVFYLHCCPHSHCFK